MVSGVPYYFETPHVVSYQITNGFAGIWFRQEKPLRFRAGPALAATSAVRRDIFVEPQIENPHPACGHPLPSDGRGTSPVGAAYSGVGR